MAAISCIIVEDEKPAQEVLRSFIAKTEWLDLAATFGDAVAALDYLKKNEIDLIFLDIQIPGITGLDFLKILKNPPEVIITTAFSEHAIEAFELEVRDYLMKPFSFDRFLKAVGRINPKPDPSQVHHLQPPGKERTFGFFNVNKTMVKVMYDDIRYVESMREYVYIHDASRKIITKMGLGEIEKLLGQGFLRVHRSYLINLDKVMAFNAEEVVVGTVPIPIGAHYKKIVEGTLAKMAGEAENGRPKG